MQFRVAFFGLCCLLAVDVSAAQKTVREVYDYRHATDESVLHLLEASDPGGEPVSHRAAIVGMGRYVSVPGLGLDDRGTDLVDGELRVVELVQVPLRRPRARHRCWSRCV